MAIAVFFGTKAALLIPCILEVNVRKISLSNVYVSQALKVKFNLPNYLTKESGKSTCPYKSSLFLMTLISTESAYAHKIIS